MKLTPEQAELAATFYGLATTNANRYRNIPGVDFDDLKSACHEAVCRAVVKYDPDHAKGKTLKSYVIDMCRWACFRVVCDTRRRPPLVAESPIQPTITDRPFPSLEAHITDFPAYHRLTPRVQEVLTTYIQSGNLRTTARKLGVSHQYVGQEVSKFIQSAKADIGV